MAQKHEFTVGYGKPAYDLLNLRAPFGFFALLFG
jgi:hypothetical protein